ncbi:MAG: DeoR/GlpR transcriptional regulator [Chloroflexaceae bacterium]|nr:DeoR/GlpR transcriptional regulator [Chloroflexaceae bacterium]
MAISAARITTSAWAIASSVRTCLAPSKPCVSTAIVFLAAQSIDAELGVTDTSFEIAQVKRAMVHAARQVILVADSSKWSRHGFIKVVPFTNIHMVITDDELPDAARARLAEMGVALHLV